MLHRKHAATGLRDVKAKRADVMQPLASDFWVTSSSLPHEKYNHISARLEMFPRQRFCFPRLRLSPAALKYLPPPRRQGSTCRLIPTDLVLSDLCRVNRREDKQLSRGAADGDFSANTKLHASSPTQVNPEQSMSAWDSCRKHSGRVDNDKKAQRCASLRSHSAPSGYKNKSGQPEMCCCRALGAEQAASKHLNRSKAAFKGLRNRSKPQCAPCQL